ncbi:MAG: hypothetical protein D6731_06725 [Planctomycetota bacterium]|nr:MAG: hypothetical protein D6731_06725 [Planctomycetota bacterium]
MRSSLWILSLALSAPAACATLAPAPAYADDDDDDEYESNWIGARLGIWYRPEIHMRADVGGNQGGLLGLIGGTDFDIERTLGVEQNIHSEYTPDLNQNALWELEFFVDTDLFSVYVTLVPPYEYHGTKTLTEQIEFGGQVFNASTNVKSVFEQMLVSLDATFNIFDNRYFKLAPLAGIRFLLIDWELEETTGGLKADTSDIDSPFSWEDFEIFPTPELGLDVRVGYRDIFEVGGRVSASYVQYLDMEGGTYRAELFVRLYPIPILGIEVGYRFLLYDISSRTDDPTQNWDFDLEFSGFTAAVTLRF